VLVQRLAARLPAPAGEDAAEIAYSEAMARRLAARRTLEALGLFEELGNVHPAAVEGAREVFSRREHEATDALARLDQGRGRGRRDPSWMADALARVAAEEALSDLTETGLLPKAVARDATGAVGASR
jgi:hypothetical protein